MNLMNDIGLNLNADFRFVIPEDTVYKLPPLEDVVYDALINSELIKVSHNVVAISKDKIKIAMSSFLPQISLNGGLIGTGLTLESEKRVLESEYEYAKMQN